VAESLRLIGVAGKAGAGKDTFYQHVLKPRGYLRWQMPLHYKVWLAARGHDWDDIFYDKPPHVRKVLQEEITALRHERGEEIWLNTLYSDARHIRDRRRPAGGRRHHRPALPDRDARH
jgi:dephospho-CoA kinase